MHEMMRRFLVSSTLLVVLVSAALALCFFGFWIPNEPSRAKYPIRGIDVSHHQGGIDWLAVKASNTRFAYIKATEGASFRDPKFSENWGGGWGSSWGLSFLYL
jgi:lysozyme